MSDTQAASGLRPAAIPEPIPWQKRALDLIAAGLLLVLAAPLMLLVALGIKLSSRGPVLYAQRRIGLSGRSFGLLKFRTMTVGSDDSSHRRYVRAWIDDNAAYDRDGNHKIIDDPRVFGLGRLLRRFSFDELPQLLNVLRGEMSLVGPRPALSYEVERYQPRHRRRLVALPGITGLWQVSGRHRLSFEQMVALDLDYLEHWSLGRDLAILWRTVAVVLFEPGY